MKDKALAPELNFMKSFDPQTSTCRRCRHYIPEGRRGGNCSQLNAIVQGTWQACSLAAPVFEPTWELGRMLVWQGESSTGFTHENPSEPAQIVDPKMPVEAAEQLENQPQEIMV
jgi:hypothetical protein